MSYADIKNKRKSSSLLNSEMTQLHTDEILNQNLTVTDIDVIETKSGKCCVMLFEEYPDQFYFGGKVLTEMCEEFIADEDAMESLKSGEVVIKLNKAISSSTGREYVTYDYVE